MSQDPTSPHQGRGRPQPIVIPDHLSSGGDEFTDTKELQYAIYLELTKITRSLNATSKSPATESSPEYSERTGAVWPPSSSRHLTARESGNSRAKLEAAEYDALGQQFTTLVIISTFTANLIIGFLTLAHNVLSARTPFPRIKFEIGMFFVLSGMAIHSGVIIIAGRSAALALKYAKRLPVQAYLREDREDEYEETTLEGYEIKDRAEAEPESSNSDGTPSHPKKGKEPEHVVDPQTSPGPDEPQQPSITTTAATATATATATAIHQTIQTTPLHFWRPFPRPQAKPGKLRPSLFSPAFTETTQDLRFYDFHLFLKVCESLQLLGTTTFFLGVMIFIFIIFFHRVLPIILLVGWVLGSLGVSWRIGFWKVSATNQLIGMARKIWRTWKKQFVSSAAAADDDDDVHGVMGGDKSGDKLDPARGGSSGGGGSGSGGGGGGGDSLKPSLKKEEQVKRWSATKLFGVHWPPGTEDVEKIIGQTEKKSS